MQPVCVADLHNLRRCGATTLHELAEFQGNCAHLGKLSSPGLDAITFCDAGVARGYATLDSSAACGVSIGRRRSTASLTDPLPLEAGSKQFALIMTPNNRDFDAWCRSLGNLRPKSAPYQPKQNGCTERWNQTLKEKTRAMLTQCGFPVRYWAEAMAAACHVYTLLPCKGVRASCHELFWGTKPDVGHLRVLVSEVYPKLQAASRRM